MRRYILDINLIRSLESTGNLLTYRPSEDDNATMEDLTLSPSLNRQPGFLTKGYNLLCYISLLIKGAINGGISTYFFYFFK
jgi:hypothetical protein